ncbi:MAG: hypothetical protein M3M84_06190 [Thermoproteota archaeon]|nr:hypothetical protein [Thermoproteota archaeon]
MLIILAPARLFSHVHDYAIITTLILEESKKIYNKLTTKLTKRAISADTTIKTFYYEIM